MASRTAPAAGDTHDDLVRKETMRQQDPYLGLGPSGMEGPQSIRGEPARAQAVPTSPPAQVSKTGLLKRVDGPAPGEPAPRLKVDPVYWQEMQKRNPTAAGWIANASKLTGVPPEILAFHKWKESRFASTSPVGSSGEHGVFQFMPGTRNMIDPHHELDPNDGHDGALLAGKLINHIAYTQGKGMGTPAQIAAYNGSGPMARAYAADAYRNAITGGPGPKIPEGAFNTPESRVNPGAVVQAASQGGPDAAMRYLVETAPSNLNMSDKWRHLEGLMVASQIMKGDMKGAAAARDFVGHLAYDGTNQHLMAAYQSLNAGLGEAAAQHLAAAHAFFPDGTIGQFYSDGKNVYAQRRDEDNPEVSHGATMITPDVIAAQFNQTKDPVTFLQVLTKHQQEIAKTRHYNAQTAFEEQRPAIAMRGQDLTNQARNAAIASQAASAADRTAATRESTEARTGQQRYATDVGSYDKELQRRQDEEKYLTEVNARAQAARAKGGAGAVGDPTLNKAIAGTIGDDVAAGLQSGEGGKPSLYKPAVDPSTGQVAILRRSDNSVVTHVPPHIAGYFTGNWAGNTSPTNPVPPNAFAVRSNAPVPTRPVPPGLPGYAPSYTGGQPRVAAPVAAPQAVPQYAPQPAQQYAPQPAQQYAPQGAPQYAPQYPPQYAPQYVPQGALPGDYGSSAAARPDLWEEPEEQD